jgi:hypothetical protein
MKIKIQNNQIRLRLNPKETEDLGEGRQVTEVLGLTPIQQIRFVLSSWNLEVAETKWDKTTLHIIVPENIAKQWAHNKEMIELPFEIDNGSPNGLLLSVEKDFAFLKKPH